jgi:RNA polymerase sigma-70 factor, ECF subfamily
MLAFQDERDYAPFEELFRRNKDALLRFLIRLSGNRTIAEDVSQHAWLKVIDMARQQRYRESPGAPFRTWLYTLARNHFLDEYKRKFAVARSVPLEEGSKAASQAADAQAPDPSDIVAQHQLQHALNDAITSLPFEQRDVIALWSVGVEIDSIASITGAPQDTVLSRKKYAIARLRSTLGAPGCAEQA